MGPNKHESPRDILVNVSPIINDPESLVDIPVKQGKVQSGPVNACQQHQGEAGDNKVKGNFLNKTNRWSGKGRKEAAPNTHISPDSHGSVDSRNIKKRAGSMVFGGNSGKKGKWVVAGSIKTTAVADVQPRRAV